MTRKWKYGRQLEVRLHLGRSKGRGGNLHERPNSQEIKTITTVRDFFMDGCMSYPVRINARQCLRSCVKEIYFFGLYGQAMFWAFLFFWCLYINRKLIKRFSTNLPDGHFSILLTLSFHLVAAYVHRIANPTWPSLTSFDIKQFACSVAGSVPHTYASAAWRQCY